MAVIRAARPEFKSKMDRVAFAVHASTLIATEMAKQGMEMRNGAPNDDGNASAVEAAEVEMLLVGVGRDAETASEAGSSSNAPKEQQEQEELKEVGVEGWNTSTETGYAFRYRLMGTCGNDGGGASTTAAATATTNDDGAGAQATSHTKKRTVLIKAVPMEHVLVVSALVTGWTSPFSIELDVDTFTNNNDGLVDGFANVDGLAEKLANFVATIVHGKAKRDDVREARDRGEEANATVLIDEQRVGHDPLRVPRMRPGGHVGPTIPPHHPLSVGGHDLDPFQPSMTGIPGRGPLGPQPGNVVGPDHPLFSGRMPPPRPYPGFGGGGGGMGGGGFYPPPWVPPGARFDPYEPPGVPDFPGPERYPPGYGHPDLPQPPDGDDGPPPSMFM